ncbi:MAG: hypothetical protein DI536_35315 [Archangium gephyra]|uniref:Lipoprotein n=1 Tax=Archangium gephyra TaxID=48 RepID=A0A2W5SL30_9BACT|nr:MAG: hypothetical protein DI536_35315 [Archangium gephyra]
MFVSTRFRCGEGWLLLGVLLSGCINPDDILGLSGMVRAERPVAGQQVTLSREKFASAGGPCIAPVVHERVAVGESGTFEFELLRAEAQRLTGFSAGFCLRVETTFDSGVHYQVDIPSLGSSLELPPFVDWNPNVRIDGGLQFEPAPFALSDAGQLVSHRIEFRSDAGIVWRWDSHQLDADGHLVPASSQLDSRVLGEFESEVLSISARQLVVGNDAFLAPTISRVTDATVTTHTTLPFRHVAWTFGAPCLSTVGNCPLTDRRLVRSVINERTLELNLQSTIFVDLIALRGFVTASDFVEMTVLDWRGDAHVFSVALPRSAFSEALEERFLAVPIDIGDNPAWLVRLEFPEPVTTIRELSVFRPD